MFENNIKTKKGNIIVISNFKYIEYKYSNFEIYYSSSETNNLFLNRKYNDNGIDALLLYLQQKILRGIFIVVTNTSIFIGGPLFDNSISWIISNNEFFISESPEDLAMFFDLNISKTSVALNLIQSLPYYPFQNISLWENLNMIPPFHILKYSSNKKIDYVKVWDPPSIVENIDASCLKIREELLNSLGDSLNDFSMITTDLSGGVDSAVIAYILNKFHENIQIFHAKSDDIENSDSKWAQLLSDDLNLNLQLFPSLGDSGRSFQIEKKYHNCASLDSPLLWSDTEGYVERIRKLTLDQKNVVHFTGLGGDELFTSMPSNPWSVVRERKLQSIPLSLKYCSSIKAPLLVGLRGVLNNMSFQDALKKEIDKCFGYINKGEYNLPLNWCDEISMPKWINKKYREPIYNKLIDVLDSSPALDADRSRHQIIESLLFQNHLLKQINRVYGNDSRLWTSPFLNVTIIQQALTIPASYKQDPNLNKPVLYKITKGLVSKKIFTRISKGDYWSSIYKQYKEAVGKYIKQVTNFKLVELEIIDPDILISELSMPTSVHERIGSFEKLMAMERWLRVNLKNTK